MDSASLMSGFVSTRRVGAVPAEALDERRASSQAPSSTTTMTTNQNRILSTETPLEQEEQHEAGTAVCQENESEAHKRPAQGCAPAPAAGVAAKQEATKGEPCEQCEDGLVVQREEYTPCPQGNRNAGKDSQRKHAETDPDQTKQQPLLSEQGRQGIQGAPDQALPQLLLGRAMQLTIEQGHEQGVQGCNSNQPVGTQRYDEVCTQPIAVTIGYHRALREQSAQHGRQCGSR